MNLKGFLMALTMFASTLSFAAVSVQEVGGWFESGYATFTKDGSKSYNVYYKSVNSDEYLRVDGPLVRDYGTYARVDMLGIKAGDYKFKIVPVAEDGTEKANEAVETNVFTAKAHDRGGFAHLNYTKGIGAYNDNGTLKAGAKVVYVTAENAKTVTCEVDGKTFTGLQGIMDGRNGKYGTTPVAVRIIGMIKITDTDELGSSSEGLQIKGQKSYTEMNVTFEGVGNDAVIHGFGILMRNCTSVELRNFAVMNCKDDCVSLDTDNSHCWIHNIDFFYGNDKGGDQAKGDGSLDVKGDSQYITFSYNHFWDSGKSSLCGMKSESGPNYMTYHHNWFDHSDSRHPRVRTMSVHVYNNYFDGNAKYGVGATTGSSVFVESNYYRNTNKPMMISMQGTDIAADPKGKGTFSGENGGMIKAYGNVFKECTGLRYVTYQNAQVEFDAYEVTDRSEKVPATVKAKLGGSTYDNFDTNASLMYSYTPDAADDVPGVVTGQYGAGRMQHGDFEFAFNNATDDSSYDINTGLKTKMLNYQSSFVGIIGDDTVVVPTGITAPVYNEVQADGPIYDLSGRVVRNPQRGIYIQNGKKFIIQ